MELCLRVILLENTVKALQAQVETLAKILSNVSNGLDDVHRFIMSTCMLDTGDEEQADAPPSSQTFVYDESVGDWRVPGGSVPTAGDTPKSS